MLSNTDFADLLKSGSSNGLTSDGKSRFNLEQVKTWDKQNDAKGKKKPSSFGKTPARGGDGEDSGPKPDKYRDRAFERRKDVVTSEEAALEAVVSKLDAEQTKFLGGDVEHTHLVKGLDYALLRKIRDQEKEQNEDGNEYPNSNLEKNLNNNQYKNNIGTKSAASGRGKEGFKDFITSSSIAENLKNMLLNPESSMNISKNAATSSRPKAVADTIARIAFEFDLSEDTDRDLPTIISKSKKEWTDGLDSETFVSCLLSKELGLKLSSIFGRSVTAGIQNERQLLKRKRREQLLEEKQKNSVYAKKPVPKIIAEDIFADVGKYVPVGALDEEVEMQEMLEEGEERESDKGRAMVVVEEEEERIEAVEIAAAASTAKGIFSNLLPSFPSKIRMAETVDITAKLSSGNAACVFDDGSDDEMEMQIEKNKNNKNSSSSGNSSSSSGISSKPSAYKSSSLLHEGDNRKIPAPSGAGDGGDGSDLMAPVRALLAAQRVKEEAAIARSEARATTGPKVPDPKAFTSLAMGADGRSKVHRDVFGVVGNSGAMGGRAGDAMGHGSYDDYGGENLAYGSDEDEEEGKEKITGKTGEDVMKEGGSRGEKEYKGKEKENKKNDDHKDYKKDKKEKIDNLSGDSSGNWRNSAGKKDTGKAGEPGEKQSAIRPRVENNRAARRAGKS